jgi:hypothetical protein
MDCGDQLVEIETIDFEKLVMTWWLFVKSTTDFVDRREPKLSQILLEQRPLCFEEIS